MAVVSPVQQNSSTHIDDIKIAVSFLARVDGNQYDETALRNYLLSKRQLSATEIDEAFLIHGKRCRQKTNNTERPEVNLNVVKRKDQMELSYLIPNKKDTGQRLIADFFNSEENYCHLLTCLWHEYCIKIAEMAYQQKLSMSHESATEMFKGIPRLVKFHNRFYKDLKRGGDIGQMFVRLFSFFRGYLEYMTRVTLILKKLGEYAGDKALRKCLSQIRMYSECKPYDMAGMLLVPLDRIVEYRIFLENLLKMTDKSQTAYDYLSRAARRIGKVALYIEKYRFVINNLYEVYRVQVYLAGQINILVDQRRLIRRGMLIRRTTGWTARNKDYVFFLFNDILLWTTKTGKFLNFLYLYCCEVLPWEVKNNFDKKFMIVSNRKNKVKTLYLECKTSKQKTEWCDTLKKAISDSKKIDWQETMDLPAAISYEDSEDVKPSLNLGVRKSLEAHGDIVSGNKEERNSIIISSESNSASNTVTEGKSEGKSEKPNEEEDFDSESEDASYDYEQSHQYPNHEFHGYQAFDDTSSQVSESEYSENSVYKEIRNCSTIDMMNPFRNYSRSKIPEAMIQELKNPYISQTKAQTEYVNCPTGKSDTDFVEKSMTEGEDTSSLGSKRPERVRRSFEIQRSKSEDLMLEKVVLPNMTISLSDFL